MLRRFSAAMSFFVSDYVSRADRVTLVSDITTIVETSFTDVTGDITVEFGAQEW